ncbi:MAG: hypothetical protein KDH88_19660 [Chromatiales bacterium]|nr:hypothetical protein [Chromatiales bacterium]
MENEIKNKNDETLRELMIEAFEMLEVDDAEVVEMPPIQRSEAERAALEEDFFARLRAKGIESVERPVEEYFYPDGEAPPLPAEQLAAIKDALRTHAESLKQRPQTLPVVDLDDGP